jgi:hypothetical protein
MCGTTVLPRDLIFTKTLFEFFNAALEFTTAIFPDSPYDSREEAAMNYQFLMHAAIADPTPIKPKNDKQTRRESRDVCYFRFGHN